MKFEIYRRLARIQKSPENRSILERIAEDEKRHYNQWKSHTGEEAQVDWSKVRRFFWITRIFGLTFGTKLMERGEVGAQMEYSGLIAEIDQAKAIARDESDHENALLGMLDEERLRYIGSVVLGLNDALVELTGALAGLTLALQKTFWRNGYLEYRGRRLELSARSGSAACLGRGGIN
jgi:demethoxyubiquinone hydroxylase (CLK1/Coq7/Cat5 family)